jgi:hypothetical protein
MLQLLKRFLYLGVIVGPLPNNIIDGTLIDAVPVMGNFNWIVNQVNANVPSSVPISTAITPWTPVVSFGGGTTGITYSTQNGQYVQVGSIIHFMCAIVLTSKGSSTGVMAIGGLPFACNALWVGASVYPIQTDQVTYTGQCYATLSGGQTSFAIINNITEASGNPTQLTDANVTTANMSFCGIYAR